MSLEVGQIVAGRYILERPLGEGGMGIVWAAVHSVTRRTVALKMLRPSLSADPRVRSRFEREARAACAVKHPNVVDIHDVIDLEDGSPAIVMDLLEGETLGATLARKNRIVIGELADILLPVVSAVSAAHANGVVHRDLKPDNIFVARTPHGNVVKVLDFGIAKVTLNEGQVPEGRGLTATDTIVGTPYYMSPEQVFGEKDIDYRADLWSLGIILYECLSGTVPTSGSNIGQIIKTITAGRIPSIGAAYDVPEDVSRLVDGLLTRDRAARPTGLAVMEVLGRYTDVVVEPFREPRGAVVRTSVSPLADGKARIVTGDGLVDPLQKTGVASTADDRAEKSGAGVSPAAMTILATPPPAAPLTTMGAAASSRPAVARSEPPSAPARAGWVLGLLVVGGLAVAAWQWGRPSVSPGDGAGGTAAAVSGTPLLQGTSAPSLRIAAPPPPSASVHTVLAGTTASSIPSTPSSTSSTKSAARSAVPDDAHVDAGAPRVRTAASSAPTDAAHGKPVLESPY